MIAIAALVTAFVLFILLFFAKKIDVPYWLLIVGIFFFIGLAAYKSVVILEKNQIGIQFMPGQEKHSLMSEGFNFRYPLSKIYLYSSSVRTVRYNDTTKQLSVSTADGVTLPVDCSIVWKLNAEDLPAVYNNIGKSNEDIEKNYLMPRIESTMKDAIGSYEVNQLFGKGRISFGTLAQEITTILRAKLAERGIVIEEVIIESLVEPQAVRAELDKQALIRQEMETFELLKKRTQQEADIQNIINTTYTQGYLQNEAIKMMREMAQNKNTTFVIVPTQSGTFSLPLVLPDKKTGE